MCFKGQSSKWPSNNLEGTFKIYIYIYFVFTHKYNVSDALIVSGLWKSILQAVRWDRHGRNDRRKKVH